MIKLIHTTVHRFRVLEDSYTVSIGLCTSSLGLLVIAQDPSLPAPQYQGPRLTGKILSFLLYTGKSEESRFLETVTFSKVTYKETRSSNIADSFHSGLFVFLINLDTEMTLDIPMSFQALPLRRLPMS